MYFQKIIKIKYVVIFILIYYKKIITLLYFKCFNSILLLLFIYRYFIKKESIFF